VLFRSQGLLDTLEALRHEGLPWIGAGADRDSAQEPRFLEVGGLRVGFLGFTSTFPESAWARKHRPGVAFSEFAGVAQAIRETRKKCDVLIVSFHGGTELAEEPNEVQRSFAKLAVDSGADLVLGHHPHVIQPMEIVGGKPVLHSLGNFLFVSPTPTTRPTVAARVSLSTRGVEGIEFVPLDTNWGRPVPADAAQREGLAKVLDRYGALSAEPARFRVAPLQDR
jgi:poly-gamma-glutamate synthesis protein (capsule biosynthesis protein)